MQPTALNQTIRMDNGIMRTATMTISNDITDAAFVLRSMTDLYANRRLAPIREIFTNALDAHAAAGQTRPVLVTLPSITNGLFFTVQDFGTGLDWDDLENIYAKFGRSTKRDTNDQTGMLGFGCKSPLTYVLSFTITAVKNGTKVVAVISKNEHGIGEIKLLDESATTEPNGVTVKIPVPKDDLDQFLADARHFFSFQREGVLVDGTKPEPIEGLQPVLMLDPDVWVIPQVDHRRYRVRQSYVVQGGVPYPYETKHGYPNTIAWVPIGSISFPPSREALQNDAKTDEVLGDIRDFIDSMLSRMIDFALLSTTTMYEYHQTRIQLREDMPQGFKHKRLHAYNRHHQLSIADDAAGRERFCWYVWGGTASRQDSISYGHLADTRTNFVRGFTPKGVSTRHKEMIKAHGIAEPYYIVPENPGFSMTGFPGCHWSDVQPLPRAPRAKRSATGPTVPRTGTRYTFFIEGDRHLVPEYDDGLPVIYTDNDEGKARQLSQRYPEVAVASIIVGTQRSRFERLHPGARPWREWHREQIRAKWAALTKDDHAALDAEPWQRQVGHHLGGRIKDLKDRSLRSVLSTAVAQSPNLQWLCEVQRAEGAAYIANALDAYRDTHVLNIEGVASVPYRTRLDDQDVKQRYPMMAALMSGYTHAFSEIPAEEWVIYLNARHRENQKILNNNNTDAADAA